MSRIANIFKDHSLIKLYTIVFLILLYGVLQTSGFKFVGYLAIFFASLIGFYLLFNKVSTKKKDQIQGLINRFQVNLNEKVIWGMVGLSALLVIAHLIVLGGIPGLQGFSLMRTSQVLELRKSVTADVPGIWNYISSFNLKAIIPFLVFFLLYKQHKKAYWVVLVLGIIYAFALMQKSYILVVLAPSMLFALMNRKRWTAVKYILISGVVIVSLVYVSNPPLRGGINDTVLPSAEPVVESDYPYIVRVFVGLQNRVLVVPGEIVSEWFEHVPKDKPFLEGSGYKIIAKMKGEEFRNYAKELYPIIRPNYAERGLSGSVNSASFMYEYSNFGWIGLILSGFMLALYLTALELIFIGRLIPKIALNAFPIFMLSSGALTTALFSGGWGLTVLLFLMFRNKLSTND